jgi:hypothetical protein
MQDVKAFVSHPAPAGRPHPLAFHAGKLWVGSWDTTQLYAVDTQTWTVSETVHAPGKPYGLTSFGGALHAVISLGEDDDRYLYRLTPGGGFDEASKMPCPDYTGSHLTTDGKALYLVQQTNRRIVQLDEHGAVQRAIPLPTRSGGCCFDAGTCYMISADDDFDVLEFGTLDIAAEAPQFTSIAPISAESRGLAFDGKLWWTNYRELNETVSFAL